MHVTDGSVASHAEHITIAPVLVNVNCLHDVFVAVAASVFHDLSRKLRDLDRFMEVAGRKIIRMPKSISSFGVPFAKEVVRSVAVVTPDSLSMARVYPTVILLIHNMAIDTGRGVVGQIGPSLCINKRICSETK